MDEEDVHLCCKCHKTFIGLDVYVRHRKSGCKGPTNGSSYTQIHVTENQILPKHEIIHQNDITKPKTIKFIPRSYESCEGNRHVSLTNEQNDNTLRKPPDLNELVVDVSCSSDGNVSKSNVSESIAITSNHKQFKQSVNESSTIQVSNSDYKFTPKIESVTSKTNTFSFNIPNSGLLSPGLNTDHLDTNFMLGPHTTSKDNCGQIEPVHQSAASVAEFFSSLELKHRKPTESDVTNIEPITNRQSMVIAKTEKSDADLRPISNTQHDHSYNTNLQHQDTFEERLKHLKIVNILNDLEFDSDSEGLPSDVDELLNFGDDDYKEPRQAGGGKWKPGMGAAPYQSRGKGGKLGSYMRHTGKNIPSTGGKWKPGTGPSSVTSRRPGPRHSGGKLSAYKHYKGLTDSEDEEEEEQETAEQDHPKDVTNLKEPKKEDRGSSKCVTCDKTFSTKYYLANHIKTPAHKRRVAAAAGKKKSPTSHQCPLCKSFFSTKENFLRHLSKEIKRNANGTEKLNLSENIQILLQRREPFQCKICAFFTDSSKALVVHLGTEDHISKCAALMHPIVCVRCKFSCTQNSEMLAHFETPEHVENVEDSDRPCIVKENKTRVVCKECDQIVPTTQLQEHIAKEHQDTNSPRHTKRVRHKPFCVCCNKQWESESALAIHLSRKGGYRPHECPVCNLAFTTHSDLLRHCQSDKHIDVAMKLGTKMPRLDPSPTDVEPLTEGTLAEESMPLKRKRGSKAKGYMCKYEGCDFRAAKYTELRQHYESHAEEGSRFQCKVCNYSTNHMSHFDVHKKTAKHIRLMANASKSNAILDNVSIQEHTAQVDSKTDVSFIYDCPRCDQKFSNQSTLYEHQMSHVNFTEKELLRQCGGDELIYCAEKYHPYVKQLPTRSDAIVTCPECDKTMPRHAIVPHLRCHANIRPFHCIFCDKAFAKGDNLRSHIMLKHIQGKKLCCEFCSQRYSAENHLQQHMLSKHRDKVTFKPKFVCRHCGAEFMIKSLFVNHEKIHEHEKPFACPVPGCFIRFATKSGLQCHTRRHNNEKTHLCDFCGFATLTMAELRRHERIHTNNRKYKCDYCSYSSVTSSGLARHLLIHSGSKAYKCPHCSFRGPDLNRLRKHCFKKKDHQGLKLFNCHLCIAGFDGARVLQTHLLANHQLKVSIREASVLAGVIDESDNAKTVAEGQMVIPVQEKFYRKNVRANLESFQSSIDLKCDL